MTRSNQIRSRLFLFTTAVCLLTFYLACERDFSAVGEKKTPSASDADTTSHDFIWEIDTLGVDGRGSSFLLDVAIIHENDMWAVGEIHTAETDTFDSLGNWVPPYNAVHWNGQKWELKRILYQGGFWTIRSIFAFSSFDVWFSAIVKWNGSNFIEMPIPGIFIGHRISKMWGTSANDLYAVGTEGLIAYYNGSSWQELQSGTSVDIQDIWGAMNPQSGESEILAVASFGPFPPQAKQLLSIQGTTVTAIPDSGLALSLAGIWFVPGKIYYVVGDGVFYAEEIGQFWRSDTTHPLLYKVGVRGNAANDVFVTGSFGLVSHYNGSTWHHYSGAELPIISGGYGRVSFKSNCVVAVGRIGDQAIILRGIRN